MAILDEQRLKTEVWSEAVLLPRARSTWTWLATAVLTGAIAMGLEIVAFRLYAPYFGYSVYVWGSMISVVMAALAAGYAIGGRLADKTKCEFYLYSAILFSAAYQLLILGTVPSFLPRLSLQGEFVGAALATILIFAPSMGALAATGPLIVRLCSRMNRVGSASGKVYALSTVGSMAGILATSFFLIPRLGTEATLKGLCAASFLTAVSGLMATRRVWVLAMLPASGLLLVPGLGWDQGAAWTAESAYNLIRVVRSGGQTALVLNHYTSVHTIREESQPWTGYYYDYFALGPMLVPANRLLVLGMGAGGSIRTVRAVAPQIAVDAVELDPKVVDAARQFFGVDPSDSRVKIHVADARPWLAKNTGVYDLVHVDLYQGGPYIPFYLATEEFFRQVRSHVAADGVVMMNVFDPSRNARLLNSIAATMHREFPSVMEVRLSGGNHMLFGFARTQNASDIQLKLMSAQPDGPLQDIAANAASQIVELNSTDRTLVLTDDRAPVEELTRSALTGK
jgi:spermidine synthase